MLPSACVKNVNGEGPRSIGCPTRLLWQCRQQRRPITAVWAVRIPNLCLAGGPLDPDSPSSCLLYRPHRCRVPLLFRTDIGAALCVLANTKRRFDDKGNVVLDLGDTVGKMKQDFGVEQVFAWHAMSGYWAGVEPEAPEMTPFDPQLKKLLAPKGIRKVDPEVSSRAKGVNRKYTYCHIVRRAPCACFGCEYQQALDPRTSAEGSIDVVHRAPWACFGCKCQEPWSCTYRPGQATAAVAVPH